MKILNFHDLGEEGASGCYNELLKYWDNSQITTGTYNYSEEDPSSILLESMVNGPYDLIVGTGFGGVLALIVGRATGARTVLVNPMYPIQRYLPAELPNYEYGNTLSSYEHGRICWDDDNRQSLKNVFLVLGRDDDITDTARTPAYFYAGNSYFVEGGHRPEGDDFVQTFGMLTGGIWPADSAFGDDWDYGRESQALDYLREWFVSPSSKDVFYIYGTAQRQMTQAAKQLASWVRREYPTYKVVYVSADEIPESQEGLRQTYRDVGLLVVDNIRKSMLTDASKRSLWVACDEAVEGGGKVLLVAEETAVYVFDEGDDILGLMWSGKIKECCDWSRDSDECRLSIDDDSWCSTDSAPYEHYARHMRIDNVDTSDGHIVIRWSCPGEAFGKHTLFLYYTDGKWRRSEESGFSDEAAAALALRKASEQIIAQTESVDHNNKDFWGWMWP